MAHAGRFVEESVLTKAAAVIMRETRTAVAHETYHLQSVRIAQALHAAGLLVSTIQQLKD